jgi:hypothetical protein
MQRVFERPKVTYTGLVVLMVALFALSAVGNNGTDAENKASGVTWIGNIGWAGFMLTVLATILFSIALAIRAVRSRRVA